MSISALEFHTVSPYFAGMKLTDAIKKIFRRKHTAPHPAGNGVGERSPLRIEGVKPAPLTPEPDDAELAAQALLDTLASPEKNRNNNILEYRNNGKQDGKTAQPRDAAYYHALADRIRTARTAEARLVMRLLASVEEQLAEPTALYRGQWGDTERKLYRAMDVAEREGGELHRRWQHCLANVLVRQMDEERVNEEADAALIRQPDISSTSQPEETTII